MDARPARHDLVWLDPAREAGLEVEAAWRPEVERWLARGLPAVARRREPGASGEVVFLGIPLPPSRGRDRIALRAPAEAVARVEPPLLLAAARESAPREWRGPLRALVGEARERGVALRVHGSLAWQHLTGERYVAAGSDVDLLVDVRSDGQLAPVLALLASWERATGIHADGELRLPAGGVAWRELAAGAPRVLLKSDAAVALVPRAAALAGLATGGAP